MKLKYKYFFAVLPPFLFFCGWKLSDWAYHHYHCQGSLKSLSPCYVGEIDIIPYLGFGLFWCQLLWIPAIIFSAWLLLKIKNKEETLNCDKDKSPLMP